MAVIKPREIDDFSTLNTIDLKSTSPSYSMGYGAIPSLTAADLTLGNITIGSGLTGATGTAYTLGAQSTHANAVWTTTTTGTGVTPSSVGYNWSGTGTNIGATIGQSGKISLNGKDADVDINGKSLKSWMEQVEQRLNILTPNPELEKEWDDLKRLGDRYRKLEKKCKEKAKMWQELKKVQPKWD